MKIHVTLFLYFAAKGKSHEGAIVRGVISSPDRPNKGDYISWPYAFKDLAEMRGTPDAQTAGLTVISSGFFTETPGKITPVIEIEEARNEPGEATLIGSVEYWECVFDGVRLLIPGAEVTWLGSGSCTTEPWPASAHHLPDYLKENLSPTEPE